MKAEVTIRAKLLIDDEDGAATLSHVAYDLLGAARSANERLRVNSCAGRIASQIEVSLEPDRHDRTTWNEPKRFRLVEEVIDDNLARVNQTP